jgi:cation transport ATPase
MAGTREDSGLRGSFPPHPVDASARQTLDEFRARSHWSKDSYIALAAAVGISVHLFGKYSWHLAARQYNWPLVLTLLVGGAPLLLDIVRRLEQREFSAHVLAGLSIIVSATLGLYLPGAVVVLMLSSGTALEEYARRRASFARSELACRMPDVAHRIVASRIADITLDEVKIGDRLVVFPHEICPVDGQTFEMAKAPGSRVLAGTLNGEAALAIEAIRLPSDSHIARSIRLMEQAEANQIRMRRLAERLGAWYTPLALAVASITGIMSHDPARFLAVLVIATPCPLLVAIPIAIMGSVSSAARRARIGLVAATEIGEKSGCPAVLTAEAAGRRMRTIALQSAVGGMALSLAGIGMAALGWLPPLAGAIAQEVIDALAVLNALRVSL